MGAETILENFEDLHALGEAHREDIIHTTREEVFDALKDNMRPEFINRIDEQILFLPLTRNEIKRILRLLLKNVEKRMGRKDLKLKLTDSAEDYLADLGYDPQYGARPLKRVIQREVVNELSKHILSNRFIAGDTVRIDFKDEKLVFG